MLSLSVECVLHCYFIINIIVVICGVYVTLLFYYQYYHYYLWSVYYTVISLSILSLLSVECMLHCYFIINIIVIICGVYVTLLFHYLIVIICGVCITLLFHYQYYRCYLWSVCYTVISLSILSLLSVECMLHCYFIILSLLSVECMLHCYFIINIIVIICGVYVTLLFHYQYYRYYLWSVCYTVISLSYRYYLWSVCYTVISLSILSLSVECMLHCYFIIKIIVVICGVYVTLLFYYQNYRYYLWSVCYSYGRPRQVLIATSAPRSRCLPVMGA